MSSSSIDTIQLSGPVERWASADELVEMVESTGELRDIERAFTVLSMPFSTPDRFAAQALTEHVHELIVPVRRLCLYMSAPATFASFQTLGHVANAEGSPMSGEVQITFASRAEWLRYSRHTSYGMERTGPDGYRSLRLAHARKAGMLVLAKESENGQVIASVRPLAPGTLDN